MITTKTGKDFEKGYYHLPLKLIIKEIWGASPDFKKEMVESVREYGFTDTIILVTPPEYPNKAYRDSIDNICKNAKVASVMEVSFKSYTREIRKSLVDMAILEDEYNTKVIKTIKSYGMLMIYKAYDYVTSQALPPGLIFGGTDFASIKKAFNKAVPNTK